MSDLSIYELEDIIWDDFDRSGDHIVPHHNKDHDSEDKYEQDSCKKPRLEVTPHQNDEIDDNLYASASFCEVKKEERDPETLNKENNMMEKDSWGVFASSGDGDTAKRNVTSGSELCTDDGNLKETSGVVDSNSYNYPSSQTHQSDVNLFGNDGDDKETSDLLYYGWPDIGNFEDMDRMLSNCDSSFGLGVTGNDDELVWFTSEDPSGGYEEKMDLKFPCTETSKLTNTPQDHVLKIENKGPTPPPPAQKETSNEYNGHPLFQETVSEIYDQKTQMEFMIPGSESDLIPFLNEKKVDMKGVKKTGSLEGSSISSEVDEISLEATSFRQLQQVMEHLDVRTKLCIRDSLYRLARSAEQRHNHAGVPLLTDETNKCGGFMDMETDTNPIDRTVAHLLFHKPSESFNMPIPSPLKPNGKVRQMNQEVEKN